MRSLFKTHVLKNTLLITSKSYIEYDSKNRTTFGFTKVSEANKFRNVQEVFSSVASNYDIMNDFMSMGIHRLWKYKFIKTLKPVAGSKYIDVAGGTGDIALRILEAIDINQKVLQLPTAQTSITVVDINSKMLEYGKLRCKRLFNFKNQKLFNWEVQDAENLKYDDDTFDAYTISFGIRNCVHIEKVLDEAYRVLKPGGRFLCLEFGKINNVFLQKLYKLYSFSIIPPLGHIIAGDWKSYQYLVESIQKFPDQQEYKQMIIKANFSYVTLKNLSGGIAVISSGFKI